MTSAPLRFGLVGTGYWAHIAHAPALTSTDGIELAAVWGRDPRAAAALAAEYRATPYEDIETMLAAVDGVAFAVPPDVQAPIAAAAALLWAALGPVTSVTAEPGPADVSHLILHHLGGPSSTVTVSQNGGEAAAGFEAYLWSGAGRSVVPRLASDPVPPLRTALAELAGNIRSGRTGHPCDVSFGRDVGHVVAEAQRQILARGPG